VMVFEDKGVLAAMKESLGLFKKTWGESIAGSISIGLVFAAVGVVGFLVVLAAIFTRNLAAMAVAVALFIVLIAVLAIVSSAMNGIFVVALYTYARTGTVPALYPGDLVKGAFIPKPQSGPGTI
jgi:preprotein translocase subunit Sss1